MIDEDEKNQYEESEEAFNDVVKFFNYDQNQYDKIKNMEEAKNCMNCSQNVMFGLN